MKLFAHDLALARSIYGERERGKEPELTVRVPKDKSAPAVGDEITLHNSRDRQEPTAVCRAEVLAVAVIVRPDWTTYANPKAERQQESLL